MSDSIRGRIAKRGRSQKVRRRGGRTVRARRSGSKKPPAGGIHRLFPALAKPQNRFGLGVLVATCKREGGKPVGQIIRMEQARTAPGMRPRAALLADIDATRLAEFFGALGHADRLRIAIAVMTGSNSHKHLSELLALKAGPLYHHVHAMQLAGLLMQPARNSYCLTQAGEDLLLLAVAAERMLGRSRRRR